MLQKGDGRMGVSSDGIIAYGIDLGEGLDDDEESIFPWQSEEYDGEFEEWLLREVIGFTEVWEEGVDDGYWDRKKAAWSLSLST